MNQVRASSARAVFYDPSGVRARGLRLVTLIVAAFAGLLICGFTFSVVFAPRLAGFAARHATHTASPTVKRERRNFSEVHRELVKRIEADKRAAAARPISPLPAGESISGAYFSPWEDAGLDSLRAHADRLNRVYDTWLSPTPNGSPFHTGPL